jgi:hypothetical protein
MATRPVNGTIKESIIANGTARVVVPASKGPHDLPHDIDPFIEVRC